MDQTTDTADLLETEKYLLNTVKEDSESDSDIEEEVAQDALLGGIRSTLSTITRTARQALSTCKNKPELDDAVSKIEVSTLRLLKLEKSFLKTATIVSEVIDDLVSDFEDDEEAGTQVGLDTGTSPTMGSGDATISPGPPGPYVFQLSKKNLASVANFKDKLSKEFHKRFDRYKNDLTEEYLKDDDKFVSLMKQIKLGKQDAEKAMDEQNEAQEEIDQGNEDDEDTEEKDNDSNTAFLSHVPYTFQDLFLHKYKPYDEDKDADFSVLPTVDPITKDLIFSPLRNKFCNHVFDEDSIYDFISANPDATCPMHSCINKRPLDASHFVKDPILTAHVRQKNFNSSV